MPYQGKTLIGLTGNIACGKSTVLARLHAHGATTIDADKLIHEMLVRGGAAYEAVVQEFGKGILGADGEISRRELGMIVFSDPEKLRRLEEIEHPIVREVINRQIRDAPSGLVVLDAIKLIESGWADKCDYVWTVTCERAQQLTRLMQTRGYSRHEAETRVSAQGAQSVKVDRADTIIDNSGTLADTYTQVDNAWQELTLAN